MSKKNIKRIVITERQRAKIKNTFDQYVQAGNEDIDFKDINGPMAALGLELRKKEMKIVTADYEKEHKLMRGRLDFPIFLEIVKRTMVWLHQIP